MMKTRLLIIIGVMITVGFLTIPFYATNIYCDLFEPANGGCIRIAGIGTVDYTWLPYFVIDDESNCDEVCHDLQEPESKIFSWCADRFDQTKHEFHQSLEEYICDTPICPESEPPLFSSALNSDEEFIEKGCAKFVDKWAYMTEDNDYTWHSIYWESFVKHHYESDPLLDPQRNEKCAELFDLIMRSAEDSDLWYEITETNDFRDAKCASIVSEWEYLTKHDVWNIGISWDNVVENEN